MAAFSSDIALLQEANLEAGADDPSSNALSAGARLLYLRDVNQKWQEMRKKVSRRYGLSRAQYTGPESGRTNFLKMVEQVRHEVGLIVTRLQDHFSVPLYAPNEFAIAQDMLESIVCMYRQLLNAVEDYMRDPSEGYTDEQRQEDLRTLSAINWSHHHMMTEVFPLARCRFRHLVAFVLVRQETDAPYFNSLHLLCDGARFLADLEKCDILHRVRKGFSSMGTDYEKRAYVRSCRSAVALYMVSAYVGMSHCSLGMCSGVQFSAAVVLAKFILKLMTLGEDALPPELLVEALPVCRAAKAKLMNLHGGLDYPCRMSCACPFSDQDRAALNEGFAMMGNMVAALQAMYPQMVSRYRTQQQTQKHRWLDSADSLIRMESREESKDYADQKEDAEMAEQMNACMTKKVHKSSLCEEEMHAVNAVMHVLDSGWLSDPALTKLLGNHIIPFLECELQFRHHSVEPKRKKLRVYEEPENVEPLHWNPCVGLMMRLSVGDIPLVPRLPNGMTVTETRLRIEYESAAGRSTLLWLDMEPTEFPPTVKVDKRFRGTRKQVSSAERQKMYKNIVDGSVVFQFVPGPGNVDDDNTASQAASSVAESDLQGHLVKETVLTS